MALEPRSWTGEDWENYCLQLLSLRYGHSQFQRVPPSTGDLGIEGYSRDGCIYQCYAPDETPSKRGPYEKERDKLTEDLPKLSKNARELVQIFGQMRISRYVFMVPYFDRRLVEHAAKKAAEMRNLNLPFLCPDFEIHIVTDQDFPAERAALANTAAITINVEAPDVGEDQVGEWQSSHVGLVDTLESKLQKMKTLPDPPARAEMRSELLRFYLKGEELLQHLQSEYPATWEKLYTVKNQKEKFLVASSRLRREEAHDRLSRTIDELQQQYGSSAKEIGPDLSEELAWSTAADWLIRCPLRFD